MSLGEICLPSSHEEGSAEGRGVVDATRANAASHRRSLTRYHY